MAPKEAKHVLSCRAMAHVFVAPHPDDVALSCGGLIASLRELGQNVTILTVFSGSAATEAFNRSDIRADEPGGPADAEWAADDDRLEATQADADQSAKRFWQRASWYRRASIRNKSLAGQAVMDDVSTQGAIYGDDLLEAATAGEIVAQRRVEDERFAYFAEASVVFLDLPDAVFRGYEGDDQLLGPRRLDDDSPVAILRTEIARLEPQAVYLPLAVGNHVDHQLCRDAGVALLAEPRSWVMPGPAWAGKVVFYEDFPYAWWSNFQSLEDLPEGALEGIPPDTYLTPRYADIGDQLERKVRGVAMYESQLDRLFGGVKEMASAVRERANAVGILGNVSGPAERYWHSYRP